MKKVLSTLLVAGMFAFYACGPSAEEKANAEKATQDSIAAAERVASQADSSHKAATDSTMKMDTTAKK